MSDPKKTSADLIEELIALRRRLASLAEAPCAGACSASRTDEDRFRLLFEQAPLAYQSLDENGCVIEVNLAWLRELGYERGEVIGRWFGEFLSLEQVDLFRERFPSFKTRGEIHDIRFRIVRKDGSIATVSFDGRIGRDENGNFKQTHCIFHDITQQVRVEELTRIQRDLLLSLNSVTDLESALGLCLETAIKASGMDCGGVYLVDNDRGTIDLENVIGLSPEFVQANSHYDMASGPGQLVLAGNPVYLSHQELLNGLPEITRLELLKGVGVIPVRDRDHVVACLNVASHTHDGIEQDARNVLETIASLIGRTISRLRVEQALATSEASSREMFNALQEGIGIVDANEVVLVANPAFARIFDEDTPDAIIGKSLLIYLSEDQREIVFRETARRKTNVASTYELQIDTLKGNRKTLLVSASPRFDADGMYCGAFGAVLEITDRKKTELALKESEARFRELANLLPQTVFELTADGCLTYINRHGQESTGYGQADIDTHVLALDTIDEQDRDRAGRSIRNLLDGGEQEGYEYLMRRKDGSTFPAIVHASRIMRDKQPVGLRGVVVDVSERKKAEEALRATEEQYRLLFEGADESIIVAQNNELRLINPAFVKLSGFSEEELLSQPFAGFVHPDDRAMVFERYQRRLMGETIPTGYDFRIQTKSSETRWVRINSSLISWKGEPATLNFLVDVTARRQAEEEIRKFKTISDNASYGNAIADLQGTLLYVNRAFAEMHGYVPDELVGRNLAVFHTDEQMIAVSRIIEGLAWNDTFSSTEVWHKKKDGVEFPTLMSGVVIKNEEGQPEFLAATAIEITELKRLQEFADRARRLETAGRIAGQVAHDFNNLLGPLVAYPELIREEIGVRQPANSYLETMEAAARQMAEINQQLLTLGRRGHYNLEPLNINEVIRQVLEQVKPQSDTFFVETILATDLMNIKGGASQIVRVICNVLANAVDAMQGSGLLTIKTENWYADAAKGAFAQIPKGEYVKVTITDTGSGIPPEIMGHIFEPFFTTKTADRKRGSGLGLSVVHAVVEDHKGFVDIESTFGKGTSVYLYFPITREGIDHSDQEIAPGGSETVLVVDDDSVQREVTLRLLRKLGYRAEAVSSGEAALERLKSTSFDLLLLDMIMPGGIDGTETYRLADQLRPGQKAVILSGFAEGDRVREAQERGAGSFLKKPLHLKSLASAVRHELNRKNNAPLAIG